LFVDFSLLLELKKFALMKMVFCICLLSKTPWGVESQIGLEYLGVEKKKKNIITSKESPIAIIGPPKCIYFVYIFFFFLMSSLVMVVAKAIVTIVRSSSSWMLNHQCQVTRRSRGTHHLWSLCCWQYIYGYSAWVRKGGERSSLSCLLFLLKL
jgi:hypothetical protein